MGSAWPPSGATLPQPTSHPVMDTLLHGTQQPHPPLPSYSQTHATSPAQYGGPANPMSAWGGQPANQSMPGASAAQQQPHLQSLPVPPPSSRRFSSRSSSSNRKGPMVAALFLATMACAGTGWFFRDQLQTAWKTHVAGRMAETPPEEPSPVVEPTIPTGFNPTEPVRPPGSGLHTVPPSTSPPGSSDASPKEAVPAQKGTLPSEPPAPPAPTTPGPGGLVEVPPPNPTSPGPPVNVPPERLVAPAPPMAVEVPVEAMPAFEVLKLFMAAANWEERLKFVQAPQSMRPLMQGYYAAMPDGPLLVGRVNLLRHDKAPQTGPPHCVFQLGGGHLKKPLPIMVEQTPDGWKVDWLTFTEFKDDLLARFLETFQDEPKRFHVLVRRTHYFDDDVPMMEKKICVEVQSPSPPFVGSVFARKGTPVSVLLDRHLGWEVDQAAAVVELVWRKEGNYQWVELTHLPQFNWRNAAPGEVIPQPPPPAPSVAVPVEDEPGPATRRR